ncbi:MAG: hypothetical protein H7Y03_01010, partial [Chitinophagaceae bacterium]|nr:hypothetical protein [Chitinophagaceae bacterium]
MSKKGLLFFILMGSALCGYTQRESNEINGNFNGYTFLKFVDEVERQTSYKFYFRNEWVDSLVITAAPNQGDLPIFLAKIFEGTDLKFAIGSDRKVFITKERGIASWLADGFFPDVVKKEILPSYFDFSDYEKQGPKQKSVVDKLFTIGISNGTAGPVTISGYVLSILSG